MKSVAKVKAEFTIFKFGESEIRVLDKNGDPWFVAQDVCAALKIQNVTQAIERLDEDERSMFNIGLKSNPMFDSRVREINLVSESGMYTLVLRCRDAVNKGSVPHTFRKWVTAEVLPSVRKSGFYQKPVSDKKTRLSSATQLTPLRQTAERLITTGIGKIYPDIWKLVHQKFEIEHIHQLRPEQVFEAVEFLNAIEGEYLGKANKQLSLPISYSMEYFNQYRWMNGINEQSLSAPWRYPANMLTPNGDNPNPIGHMLEGPSCFIGSATHIYAAGRQAILQGANGGNLNILGCWLDSSFVQLDGGNVNISNCSIYLTQSTDSVIGITCGNSASNIRVFDNSFLGWTGGTPVYFNKGVFADKTIAVFGNRYASGMTNTDAIIRTITLQGESTPGTATMDPSTTCTVRYDGDEVKFEMIARWTSFSGGTGAIGIYGLPFTGNQITPMSIAQFSNNDLFKGVTPIKHTSGTSLRIAKQDGTNALASDPLAATGYLSIKGGYRPL